MFDQYVDVPIAAWGAHFVKLFQGVHFRSNHKAASAGAEWMDFHSCDASNSCHRTPANKSIIFVDILPLGMSRKKEILSNGQGQS
ncbi:MAG TPA: hypothetical protein VF509_05445 [Sphingobium sp.]